MQIISLGLSKAIRVQISISTGLPAGKNEAQPDTRFLPYYSKPSGIVYFLPLFCSFNQLNSGSK